MDGSTRLRSQVLPIARCFEGSRLEPALLASAYEQAVPLLSRPGRVPREAARDRSRSAADQRQVATIGG
jgi:hypothetical protein